MGTFIKFVLGIIAITVVFLFIFWKGFRERILEDLHTVLKEDPAAKNMLEALICYPGLHALWMHRIAHSLHKVKFVLFARIVSHINRFFTGIEIHPGATIGRRFFIDHGAGVVIGETAIIGDDVLLYAGVVLGGTSLMKKKRHPTVEDGVVMGTGAIVLGAIIIGKGAKIGAGSVVIRDVPAGATVIGVPGRVVGSSELVSELDLEWGKLPDPIADALKQIEKRIKNLEEKNGKENKGEATDVHG